jgi:cysteine sulfinate desulfinase/cysteine desulfurase-like protein
VLTALGLAPARVAASLRLGLGRFTTAAELEYAAQRIAEEVRRHRAERAAAR